MARSIEKHIGVTWISSIALLSSVGLLAVAASCSSGPQDAIDARRGVDVAAPARATAPPSRVGRVRIKAMDNANKVQKSATPQSAKAPISPSSTKSKLSPRLQEPTVARTVAGDDRVEVIVRYRDDVGAPEMQGPRSNDPRMAPLRDAREIVNGVQLARKTLQDARTKVLETRHQATVTGRFWLVDALSVTLPRAELERLAQDPDVEYVEPRTGGTAAAAVPPNVGRAYLNSDPYWNLANGWIAVIDTGVRRSHALLEDRIDLALDCINGTQDFCQTAGPGLVLNPFDEFNHGTMVAGTLTANDNFGVEYGGVTQIAVDSYRVADANGTYYLDALVRAFEAATAFGSTALNLSMVWPEESNGTVALLADRAFDYGVMVFAAMGNDGSVGAVPSPANARKVMAIGAFDAYSGGLTNESNRGPTNEGHTKPDLVGPTNTYAASNVTYTSLAEFGGTSNATAFITGAASLLRNTLAECKPNDSVYPGHVYATLLAAGSNRTNGAVYDNNIGAGVPVLVDASNVVWGAVAVTQGHEVEIDLPPTTGVDAAIWSPETYQPDGGHNDVDLAVLDAYGNAVAESNSASSVWEKVSVQNSPTELSSLRITGYNVVGMQTVYFAAVVREPVEPFSSCQ